MHQGCYMKPFGSDPSLLQLVQHLTRKKTDQSADASLHVLAAYDERHPVIQNTLNQEM